jgi:N-methylhydantoinase A
MSSTEIQLAVAVDIGGTFTDVALVDHVSGRIWRAKTPSTPSDPSEAFLNGMRLALSEAGSPSHALSRVLHGTTIATNMILEDRGARTALVTTRGFRHVLAIGRQDIPRRANLYTWIKPRRPVPASRIVEVDERILRGGVVGQPLDEASVRAAAKALSKMDVQAVAVCLIHAFANPAHERRVAEILREMLPSVAVTISTDVMPEVREYERTLTAALNASVMPGVTAYVGRLEERLQQERVRAPILLMQSNGGVAGAATIRRAPALTVLSGPAAGVVGAQAAAEACGVRDIITVDIGGTSADICLIKDGKIGLTQNGHVGDWPLPLPMVDMVTIGAGGGSIAAVTDGTLSVGPRSAGARPGPAAYGLCGVEATVTDAHVVLGHLPGRLLGGKMALDATAARRAIIASVAAPLNLSLEEAAHGILAIVDNNMIGAVRIVSVERGHDPRQFTLVPFGGAGPLHGCSLARLLGILRVMIPSAPGVLCAEGLLAADLKAEFSRTLAKAGEINVEAAQATLDELAARAAAWFDAEGVPRGDRHLDRMALLRYRGQGQEIAVPWTGTAEGTRSNFVSSHRSLYGFVIDASIELVTLRVDAKGLGHRLPNIELRGSDTIGPVTYTAVSFEGGVVQTPVVDRNSLGAGAVVAGPMIITQLDATTLILPGWKGSVHKSGTLVLTDEEPAA